jgi:hypothetical protein
MTINSTKWARKRKPMNLRNKTGRNPITIPVQHPETGLSMNLTISRLHVGVEGDSTRKLMTLMLWVGDPPNSMKAVSCNVEEDKFLDAIGHLFPNGELAEVHLVKKKG